MDYIIKNKRLEVHFHLPDETYKATRFDRMGMIKEVVLDHKDTFGAKESLIEGIGSGGQGFYNEFGIKEPIGYDEINVGEKFLKIGVGVLTKDIKTAYDYFHNYPVETFDYQLIEKEAGVTLISQSDVVNGYGFKYTKDMKLVDNTMIIDYTLENIGKKDINTTEYCHNFVAINKATIGPEYNLEFSYPIETEADLGVFQVGKNNVYWEKDVEEEFYLMLKNISKDKHQYFQLLHKPTGVGFRETCDFELERVAVWGRPQVVSPEAFVKISLAPGQIKSWQRVFEFFNESKTL